MSIHFIPWSFIKDDNLWNLVLACPTCNRRKNDKLPDEQYLDALVERNNLLMKANILDTKKYRKRMLIYVYKWSKYNGYDLLWHP